MIIKYNRECLNLDVGRNDTDWDKCDLKATPNWGETEKTQLATLEIAATVVCFSGIYQPW